MRKMPKSLEVVYRAFEPEKGSDVFSGKEYKWFFDWQNRVLIVEHRKSCRKIIIPFESILKAYEKKD